MSVRKPLRRTMIEGLERRTLLSINLIDGILYVKGTPWDDTINIDRNDDPTRIRVQRNDVIRRFDAWDVSRIVVVAADGNDI
ncbi:MAG TPA: hypothetical protein PKB10_07320, partial [Tepidisphaeraceae bacterium]|nr:hypothetical protein [Tepidisphaeraceae bacterium]